MWLLDMSTRELCSKTNVHIAPYVQAFFGVCFSGTHSSRYLKVTLKKSTIVLQNAQRIRQLKTSLSQVMNNKNDCWTWINEEVYVFCKQSKDNPTKWWKSSKYAAPIRVVHLKQRLCLMHSRKQLMTLLSKVLFFAWYFSAIVTEHYGSRFKFIS